jgi:hypothetical protein
MSAWLEMHTVLSLKVDAREAYRLMHNYRDEELAKVASPTDADGQAYDGELAMLRDLVRTLRVVARPDDADMNEVRRLLHHHAADDAAAREQGKNSHQADATPDTLAAWLANRFDPNTLPWDGMSDYDRSHWEHEAAAVRRAVARGGFKNNTTQGDSK